MANEVRLIDANALKAHINGVSTHWLNDWSTLGVLAAVDKQPTVDAVEVVHGCNVCDHDTSFECSVCGWGDWDTLTADSCKYNYCPNCGAKMMED